MEQSSKVIRLAADLLSDSIVDGPGLRTVIWTQGCGHHCPGCQNPQTWDFDGGGEVPISMVCDAIDELEGQDGITFSGGDPMFQVDACLEIAKHCKEKGLNIWVYTGFTYEQVLVMAKKNKNYLEFLRTIDVLVDGKFIEAEKDLNLLFRGSRNQRLIDVKKSLDVGRVIVLDEYEYMEQSSFKRVPMFV